MVGLSWVDFVGTADRLRDRVLTGLSGVGVHAVPLDHECPRGTGMVFFDDLGADVSDRIRALHADGRARVVAVATETAGLDQTASWALLGAGAADVVTWDGVDPWPGLAARLDRWADVDRLLASPAVCSHLVGSSPAWRSVLAQIVEVARFTDASVLITGESGTGKELVARLIHELDGRKRKRELVVLDCTTVTPSLSGSEFFGHERGSFTGAVAARDGAFAMADGGTLFLDEVGELPLRLQAELLRVIQEGMYKRVGGNVWSRTNFRLICATNRDLLAEERHGAFRKDFYYRIAAYTCRLPSLAERTGDILPLARHFLSQCLPEGATAELDRPVREFLLARSYPGNVRDLKQLIARIACHHVGPGPVTVGDIPVDERATVDEGDGRSCDSSFEPAVRRALDVGRTLKEIGEAAKETAIRLAVAEESGNLQRASRRLGVTDRALQLRRAVGREAADRSPALADAPVN